MYDIFKTVGNHKDLADEIIVRQNRINELRKIKDTTGVEGITPSQLYSIISKLEEELTLFVNKTLERIEFEQKASIRRQD